MNKLLYFRLIILTIFFWSVIYPFIWAHYMSNELGVSYISIFYLYSPEFIFALYCLFILPCIWAHKQWALYALWIGVISIPALQYIISKLTYAPWLITLFLLAFLSWIFFLMNKMRL